MAKFAFALLLFASAVLLAPASRADNNLHYFKNYFVTGDYTVAGVGLFGKGVNGIATGSINMSGTNGAPGTPAGADIVAAFLYWQTIETTPAPSSINGTFDNNAIVGDAIGYAFTPSCWSQGGSAPNAYARVYRADVLRYLPVNAALNIRVANGLHTVSLPDSGNALTSVTPHTEGATLVVVYRMLTFGAASYKSVVIFDGVKTMSKFDEFSQTLGGFYDAANTGAKMTQIVGNGQPNFSVQLTVNGKTPAGVASSIFDGVAGTRWDNPTFNISLATGANSVTTQIQPENNQVCLSWSAILVSTDVESPDGDGILKAWKKYGLHLNIGKATYPDPVPATFGGCGDYPWDPCEYFPGMGAKLGEKDVFVQIDWMAGNDGNGVHIHVPKLAALQMIYNAFKARGIIVHFDVGYHYQQYPPLPYIVPWFLARGGNVIQESVLSCPNKLVPLAANCAFPNLPYSAIGWKKGFDAIKNGFKILGIPEYFPHDRKDTFHYILFGHALAGPYTNPPTPVPSSVSGVADTPGGDLLVTLGQWPADDPANCVQDDPTGKNPNICINQTGTAIQQAGTVMHELGHNMALYHGGNVRIPNCKPDYPSVMNYLYQTRGLTDGNGNEQIDFSYGTLNPLNESALYENQSVGALTYRIRYYAPANAAEIAAGSEAKAHCDGTPTNGTNEIRTEAPGLGTPDWDNDGDPIPSNTDGIATSVDINFDGTVGGMFTDYNDWKYLNLQQVGGRLNVDGLSADISSMDLGQSDLGQSDLGQSDLGQSDLGQSDLGQSDLGQSDLGQSDLGDVDYATVISTLDATGTNNAPQGDPSGQLVANVSASTGTAQNEIVLGWGGPTVGQIRTYYIWRENMSVAANSRQLVNLGYMQVNGAPPVTTFTDPVNDFTLADSGANCPADNVCYNATYQYFVTAKDINGTISAPSNYVTVTVYHVFVTPVSGSVVYGNTIPDLTSTGAAITAIGPAVAALSTSAFSCMYAGPSNPIRNVGTYTTSCSGAATAGAGGIYGVTYNADTLGTLNITKRPLTLTAGTLTKTYDGNTNAAGAVASVSGLAPAPWVGFTDTVNPIVEMYQSANVMGTGGSTLYVSSYTINDNNSGGNYSVALVPISGTINPAPLTATVIGSQTYGGTNLVYSVSSYSGFVNNENALTASVTGALTCSTNAVAASPIGQYTISACSGLGAPNYKISYSYGTFTVNPAPLTATVMGSQVYGGTSVSFVAGFSGFVLGQNQSVLNGTMVCTSNAVPNSPVGNNVNNYTYMVLTPCVGLSAPNYTIGYVNGGFVVLPAPLTITAATSTKPYDGNTTSSAGPNSTVVGLLFTDSVTGIVETYDTPNAGINKVMTISGYTVNDNNSGANYTVNLVTNTSGEIDTRYTSDAALADFATLANYATFVADPSLTCQVCSLPYTPTDQLTSGNRVYSNVNGGTFVVNFSSAVTSIRVFPNIDHFGSAYDGYQYSISGSTDGVNWDPLFDATSVNGGAEPFTLGGFTGTPPNSVNNVLTNVGPDGTVGTILIQSEPAIYGVVGYEADFVFSKAYSYYKFGPSTAAINSNADQELSGVAALP